MADRTVRVRLEAVTDAYRREMDKAAQATKGLLDRAGGIDGIGQKMSSLGGTMTRSLTLPLAAAMGVAAKTASDLQQAVGGTAAVFGEASEVIDDYAKGAARAAGLSEREFREATTSIGGQLKRMTGDVDLAAEQSVELTKVAADLAATYGGTTAEAVAALGSAFRGEADPAERFNLNLKIGAVNAKAVEMGLAATTAQVSESARAQATLALIMEQSADAQGQFARESDSAAGSMQIARAEMENASAEIGTALLPLVADLASGVADLATWFGKLPEPVRNGLAVIAGFAAVSGPVLSFTGRIIELNTKLRDSEGNLNRAGRAAKGFGTALGIAGAAFTAINLVDAWADATTRGAESVEQLTASLLDFRDTARVSGELLRITGEGFEDLGKKIELAGNSPFSIFDSAGIREVKEANKQIDDLDKSLAQLFTKDPSTARDLFHQIRDAALEQGVSLSTVRDRFNDYSAAVAGASNEQRTGKDATEDLTGATDESIDPTEEAAEAQKELEESIKGVTNALRAQFDPFFAATDAMLDNAEAQDKVRAAELKLTEAQKRLNTVIKEHGRESDEATAASLDLMSAQRDLESANRAAGRSALDVTSAMSELRIRMEEGNLTLEEGVRQLDAWEAQGLITKGQAEKLKLEMFFATVQAQELGKQRPQVILGMDASAFWAERRRVAQAMYDLTGNVNVGGGVVVREKGGPIPGAVGQPVPIMAHGGEYVLSADVVNAIKNGRPSAGLPALASTASASTPTGGATVNQYITYPTPEPVSEMTSRTLRRAQLAFV